MPESSALTGLGAVVRQTVAAYVSAVQPGPAVTLDVDVHVVESSKREALPTYEGYRGYQPLLVSWAETGLVLADEFHDGNVPAAKGIKELVDEAYAALPPREDAQPWQVAVRSDSAAYYQWSHGRPSAMPAGTASSASGWPPSTGKAVGRTVPQECTSSCGGRAMPARGSV